MSVRRDFRAPAARWSLSEAIPALLFGALLLLVLLNLNGIWHLLWFDSLQSSQGRTTWWLIGLCAIALALTVRTPMHKSLGLPGFLFLGSLTSYMSIGTAVIHWNMMEVHGVQILRHGVYFLVVIVTAAATMATVRRTGVVRFLQWILVVLTVGCISILATPWLANEDALLTLDARMYGFYMDPNQAGRFAVMTMWLALVLILCKGNRIIACTGLGVALLAILASSSRSAILVVPIFMVLFVAYWIVLRPKIMAIAISLLIFAALTAGLALLVSQIEPIVALILILPAKLTSITTLLSGDFTFIAAESRTDLLFEALDHIEAAPLVGNGLDHLRPSGDFDYCDGVDFGRCNPHNFYLTLWLGAGIVPVVLYLGYVLSMLGTSLGLPQRATTATALGWTVARAFQSLFTDNGYQLLWLGCFSGLAFGLLMHEVRRYQDRNGSEGPGDYYGGDPSASPDSARSIS